MRYLREHDDRQMKSINTVECHSSPHESDSIPAYGRRSSIVPSRVLGPIDDVEQICFFVLQDIDP